MNEIYVNVTRSLADGEWDVDIIKNTFAQRIVNTIYTGMHTKASAIGYAIKWVEEERRCNHDDRFDPLLRYNDLLEAQSILEEMDRELVEANIND